MNYPKSKLQLLREAIKAGLVEAEIWEEKAVIIDRQTDLWKSVAVAIEGAKHGAILVIGVAAGDSDDAHGLNSDLTIPVTILARNVIRPEQMPEELLWQNTVNFLQGAVPEYPGSIDHFDYRLRYQGFTDAPQLAEEYSEIFQLARQTVFKVRMSLEPAPTTETTN